MSWMQYRGNPEEFTHKASKYVGIDNVKQKLDRKSVIESAWKEH